MCTVLGWGFTPCTYTYFTLACPCGGQQAETGHHGQRRNQGGGAHWAFAPPVGFEGALEANAAPAHEKDLQALQILLECEHAVYKSVMPPSERTRPPAEVFYRPPPVYMQSNNALCRIPKE